MPCSSTASKKAKGRVLQQTFRDALRKLGKERGLEEDDIKSTSMGVSGVDVLLSPAARKVFGPLAIECKNQESLNVTTIFWEHAIKYPTATALLVHKRNGTQPLVTMTLMEYEHLLEQSLSHE